MTSDLGSRHSPEHYILDGDSSPTTTTPVASDDDRREMAWLCGLIGCVVPAGFADPPGPSVAGVAAPVPAAAATPIQLRLTLHDGRIYTGRVHCVDAAANIILSNASQVASVIDGVPVGGFAMGQTLIAWRLVKKVETRQEK